MEYFYLFLLSFGAATLLPLGSEAYLLYLLSLEFDFFLLLVVSTVGNTLGAFVNYLLGRYLRHFALQKKYIKTEHIERSQSLFERYGFFALFFSWVPLIGDPITFVAGVLKYNTTIFFVIVGIAKMLRYLFVMYLYQSL